MMRVCHLDTCPTGIATQNPELRKNFIGDPQHVVNFMRLVARDLREYMAKLGFRTVDEMVGRSDRLEAAPLDGHWKAKHVDLSPILYRPRVTEPESADRQDHRLDESLTAQELLAVAEPALTDRQPVKAAFAVRNTDRAVGTLLGSVVSRRYGSEGLPDDTIQLRFKGSAGQSFGAFIPRGMTLWLEGDANDYLGKGVSGGKLIVYPEAEATFAPEDNIIVGNVALYGATAGEVYIRGMAGERFCVRNSGANAVVEGVGDHGLEYMTGGQVVVLGKTGRNFAAGMSGGIAYVLDLDGTFLDRCNPQMANVGALSDPEEMTQVHAMIQRHVAYTGSLWGQTVLDRWGDYLTRVIRIIPKDYERVRAAMQRATAAGFTADDARMQAFEENRQDLARVSGN